MTYSTREEAVASIADDTCRVQYDGKDEERIREVAATFTHHAVELIESLGAYAQETTKEIEEDVEAAEEAAAAMSYARRDLVEKWALAQMALSKVAFVMRAEGEAAYDRLVAALNIEGGVIDMRGL